MKLIDVHRDFKTEESCIAYLERKRWPKGVTCLKCGHDGISRFQTKERTRTRFSKRQGKVVEVRIPARHLYECLSCGYQFAATTGTIFHDTHLPLQVWFSAIALIADAKKGMAAKQLQRHLGIGSYRSAWYLAHRIRKAMEEEGEKFTGPVEVDETYLGGKMKRFGMGRGGRPGKGTENKAPVVGMKDKATKRVRLRHIPDVTRASLAGFIRDHAAPGAEIHTDQYPAYVWLRASEFTHKTVNHIFTYVSQDGTHTNGVEGVWSLLKRGIAGNFHRVSIKHLHRYLSEFELRFNERFNPDFFERIAENLLRGEGMPYRELVNGEIAL